MMGELSKYFSNEKQFVRDSQVKYFIFTTVLDYLLLNQWLSGLDSVSISSVKEWLGKRGTFGYMWGISAIRTDLWLHELVWLNIVSFDKDKQSLSLTKEGYRACQDQRFHAIYASLLDAKRARQIALLAFLVAFITAIITIIVLFK